jgi:hypothetical protein
MPTLWPCNRMTGCRNRHPHRADADGGRGAGHAHRADPPRRRRHRSVPRPGPDLGQPVGAGGRRAEPSGGCHGPPCAARLREHRGPDAPMAILADPREDHRPHRCPAVGRSPARSVWPKSTVEKLLDRPIPGPNRAAGPRWACCGHTRPRVRLVSGASRPRARHEMPTRSTTCGGPARTSRSIISPGDDTLPHQVDSGTKLSI